MRLEKKFMSKDGKSSIIIEVDYSEPCVEDITIDNVEVYHEDEDITFVHDLSSMFEVEPFKSIVDNIDWREMALELQSEKNCEQ